MSQRHKDMQFLRQCLLLDDTAECLELRKLIAQALGNERCLRRAVWLMVLLTALAIAGLSYTTIFLPNFPQNASQFLTPLIVKVFCAVGIASLICLLCFLGLETIYRRQLDRRREKCRRLATRLLECRLGKSSPAPSPFAEAAEIVGNGNKPGRPGAGDRAAAQKLERSPMLVSLKGHYE